MIRTFIRVGLGPVFWHEDGYILYYKKDKEKPEKYTPEEVVKLYGELIRSGYIDKKILKKNIIDYELIAAIDRHG